MSMKGAFWREASTLILAARCSTKEQEGPPSEDREGPPSEDREGPPSEDREGPPSEDREGPPSTDREGPPSKDWEGPPSEGKKQGGVVDYRVLMLTRSRQSSFLPGRAVFPGGAVDDEDFDQNWKGLFEVYTRREFSEILSDFAVDCERPPIISSNCGGSGLHLPADIALRITAIRETFEETGILLVVPTQGLQAKSYNKPNIKLHILPKSSGLRQWRTRIRKCPGDFQKLCRELKVLPNIWGLKEWSNWLTPSMGPTEGRAVPKLSSRFDTMFYLSCLDAIPTTKADKTEVFSPRWETPGQLLYLSRQTTGRSIKLIDPQIYELSRLCHFNKLHDLRTFAESNQTTGTQRMVSVIAICPDGVITALNGDHLKPEDADQERSAVRIFTKTLKELREEATCLNRVEWTKSRPTSGVVQFTKYKIQCNVVLKDHISPLVDQDMDEPCSRL